MPFNKHFHLLPPDASGIAARVDALTIVWTVLSLVMTAIIFILVVYFALRYRRRTEDEIPPETGSHLIIEWSWTIALFILFMVMFAWGTREYVVMRRPPDHALEINVVGKQWMWKIQHPGGQREIDELHVPVGRPVKLIMTSQDVIHSFGIPAFRIKQDVLPGSYSTQWFTATRTGEFHLFCQEYCGALHSQMTGRVVVMEPQDYEAWLAGSLPSETPAAAGERLFQSYGCAQCHGQMAPTLAGLFGRRVQLEDGSTAVADENYIRESILNPPAKIVGGYPRLMPSYRGQLSDEQVTQLVSYIKTLSSAWSDRPTTQRADVAAPVTQPANGLSPEEMPNVPPARQPPGVGQSPPPRGVLR